jgi:NAD(P)-dependent dehydrogenase (short-subunit alcohol dehydrogenase family)
LVVNDTIEGAITVKLTNKVVLITGGAAGIGWECSKAYAAEGAVVVICDINEALAKQQAGTLNGDHIGIGCDVSNDQQVKIAIQFVLARYGKLDVIHNNAGIGAPVKTIDATTLDEWDAVFNTNIKSVYLTTRHGIEALKASKGCILNTSSMVGVIGQAEHAAYSATKGAMNTLTKSMALDYAEFGVRVNAVCPAGIWTPMLHEWVNDQPDPTQMTNYLNDIHALGYCPEGDVIASSAIYLISDDAKFVTGHIMHVSGGAELGYRRA